ncbi:MAG: choice-of-anchor tandem repeat GloVer-containing protein [Terriglobales bacterium]
MNCKRAGIVFVVCVAAVTVAPAQVFTTLRRFNKTDGTNPLASLVQGMDGGLYGVTPSEGPYRAGTVFRLASGSFKILHDFNGTDGSAAVSGMVQATDGQLYGTTEQSGAYAGGTVFEITRKGALTTLYNFCAQANCADGTEPAGRLIQASGGFYGITGHGGINGGGTVFKISPQGALTTLYSFCAQTGCNDGQTPVAGLVQGLDGNFYGTTDAGGTGSHDTCPLGCGTVFKITPTGTLTTLYSFCAQPNCADGQDPQGELIQTADGNFYGTTVLGGTGDCVAGCGTVFRMSPQGSMTTLYNFCSQSSCGANPFTGLVLASDGNLFGETAYGGAHNLGTLFEITPNGELTILYNFCSQENCSDGYFPLAALVQATDGNFYGTTYEGGHGGWGTVFRLSTGLGPFVTFARAAGRVGETGPILGQGLTGTTSVFLNGTPATFTVDSDTLIRATVPPAATTGYVTVTTPSGTLTSNVPFHVIP